MPLNATSSTPLRHARSLRAAQAPQTLQISPLLANAAIRWSAKHPARVRDRREADVRVQSLDAFHLLRNQGYALHAVRPAGLPVNIHDAVIGCHREPGIPGAEIRGQRRLNLLAGGYVTKYDKGSGTVIARVFTA